MSGDFAASKPFPNRRSLTLLAVTVLAFVLAAPVAVSEDEAKKTKMTADYPELAKGHKLTEKREWDEAEEWFYEFIEDNPQHAGALRALTFVELRRPGGDAVRAEEYIERALRIEPKHAIGLFLAGKAHEARDQYEAAAKHYDRLIELGPGRDDPTRAAAVHLARFARGLIAKKQGNLERARELFDEVLGRAPQHAYATYEMGLIAAEQGKTDEAIDWMRKTVENMNFWAPMENWPYPGGRYGYLRENARYELARLLLEAGKPQEALETIEPAAKLAAQREEYRSRRQRGPQPAPLEGEADARFENAPFYKAEALAALGKTEEAEDLFREFSRYDVGDDEMHDRARDRRRELR